MTSVFASRRRAEEFHSLVEAPSSGALRDAHVEEFLAIVEQLRAVPQPEPRPEFVTGLREELLVAADTLLVPGDDRLALSPRNPRRDRRIAAAIGGIAVVGAGTSMAVAAQSALPGEMLYPLKRTLEDVENRTVSDPADQGLSMLDLAASRLGEIEALDREGHLSDRTSAVSASFVDFGDQATRASDLILDHYADTGDPALVRRLRDFTGSSMDSLRSLESQVPPSARDELLAAADVVADIDARARQACPSCGGQGVGQVPEVLLSSAATGPQVVVVPGATVESSSPRGVERRGRARDGDRRRQGDLTGGLGLTPDGGTGEDSTGSGATDPLGELTEPLTGGDGPTVSHDGDVDLGGTVKDTVKGTVDGTKKGLGGVTEGLGGVGEDLDEVTDELGDSLLGD